MRELSFVILTALVSGFSCRASVGRDVMVSCTPNGGQCGEDGITQRDCLRAGCCWNDVTTRCFLGMSHRSPESWAGSLCSSIRTQNLGLMVENCGWPSTSWQDCLDMGCCWTPREDKQVPRCLRVMEAPKTGQRETDGELRLGWTSEDEDQLYIRLNGVWGLVCGAHFYEREAQVACHQLGHESEFATIQRTNANITEARTWVNFVRCQGSESRIIECEYHAWYHSCEQPFKLICSPETNTSTSQGSTRLVGGPESYRGRLEVNQDGVWVSVCNHGFTNSEARVACSDMGFQGGQMRRALPYGHGRSHAWIDEVQCAGSDLASCRHLPVDLHGCTHHDDVSIDCEPAAQPENGDGCHSSETTDVFGNSGVITSPGYPEWHYFNYNCQWRMTVPQSKVVYLVFTEFNMGSIRYQLAVYDGPSSDDDQLRSLSGDTLPAPFTATGNTILLKLEGVENDYTDYYRYRYSENKMKFRLTFRETRVPPQDVVRLVEGQGHHDGRLEVNVAKMNNGGRGWATVCDENFSEDNAQVVCKQLGFLGGQVRRGGHHVAGTGYILLEEFHCDGNEDDVIDCPRRRRDALCDHSQDVGVSCDLPPLEVPAADGDLRLTGSDNASYGRLEIYKDGEWGTICRDGFGLKEARVACQQLGFSGGSVVTLDEQWSLPTTTTKIWMDELRCYGDEYVLNHCRHAGWENTDCSHPNDVAISCFGEVTEFPELSSADHASLRLTGGGESSDSGVVEVSYHREWGHICLSDTTSDGAALVVCRQLGFASGHISSGTGASGDAQRNTSRVWFYDLTCEGNEDSLARCAHRGLGVRGDCDLQTNTLEVTCGDDETEERVPVPAHTNREYGQCLCWGHDDPLINTYDDQIIRVESEGTYILSKLADETDSCWFRADVTMTRAHGLAGHATALMIDYVNISFDASLIRLGQNASAQVGNVELDLRGASHVVEEGLGFALRQHIDTVVFESSSQSDCNITISFLGNGVESVVTVDVSGDADMYGDGELVGLCGDCDGEADDLITAAGEDVSGRPNQFGRISESWRAASPFTPDEQ